MPDPTMTRPPWRLRTPGQSENATFPAARTASLLGPERDPLGANDWHGRKPTAHATPVVLIHGTWENAYASWNGLSPILSAQGYRVFALNYGRTGASPGLNGTADLVQSAQEIWDFVQRVLDVTGAEQVSLIGHSQGGAQARYVAHRLAPAGLVDQVIGLAPANHPLTLHGLVRLAESAGARQAATTVLDTIKMPAAEQQTNPNSPFYLALNRGGETQPGLTYTVITTRYDQLVSSAQARLRRVPGAEVEHITIQDICPQDLSDHVSLAYSRNVAQVILNRLDPADARPIQCYRQWPVVGKVRLLDLPRPAEPT